MGAHIAALALATALAQGNAAFTAGDFAGALTDYRASIAHDGKSFAAYFGAAQAALYANDLRSATEYLDAAQLLADAKQAVPVKVLLGEVQSRIRMQQAQPISRMVSIPMAAVDPLPLFRCRSTGIKRISCSTPALRISSSIPTSPKSSGFQ